MARRSQKIKKSVSTFFNYRKEGESKFKVNSYLVNFERNINENDNNIPLTICHLVSTYHNDWRNIPTPFFDKLLDSNLDSNDKYLFYVSFGKIFHHFDEKDQWLSIPMIYGKNSFSDHF